MKLGFGQPRLCGAGLTSFAALLSAAPAAADVSATLINHQVTASSIGTPYVFPGNIGSAIDFNGGATYLRGISANALSNLSSTDISFKNGIAATGNSTWVTATTGVAITFTNDANRAVKPILNSTLLAAGIGTFASTQLALGTSGGGVYVTTPGLCSSGGLINCGTPSAHATNVLKSVGLDRLTDFGEATSGFKFDVSVVTDGGLQSIYSLSGSMGVNASGQYFESLDANGLHYDSFANAGNYLSGFALTSDPADPYARTFSWGDTAVDIAFPNMLDVGESVTAIYTISTYANIGVNAGGISTNWNGGPDWTTAATIAYASFGDPVGRAGTSGSGLMAMDLVAGAGPITGLDTNTIGRFKLPTGGHVNSHGELVANLIGETISPVEQAAAIPEPASWAMMLGGFGLIGGALRRKRTLVAA